MSELFLLIGFFLGLLIDRQSRRERDERIKELEQKLKQKQNEDNQRV